MLLLPPIPSYERTSVTLPLNYDRLPGGYTYSGVGYIPMAFSFVPTFSSIDYKGTLNNDADYTFSIYNFINSNYQVTNANLTPFVAIYGDNSNDVHSFPKNDQQAWNDLALYEFGINSNSVLASCVASLPIPDPVEQVQFIPTNCTRNPRDNGGCSFETTEVPFPTSVCSGGKIVYLTTPVPSGYPANTFDKFIRITNNGYTYIYDAGFGNIVANFPTGTYTVSIVLRYYNQLLSRS